MGDVALLKRTFYFITLGCAIVALSLTAFLAHSRIVGQLNAWRLLPRPERFTELYFTNPSRLPTRYSPDQAQTLSFTVHNLENQSTQYHYAITAQTLDGKQQVLGDGTLNLKPDGSEEVVWSVAVPPLDSRVQVRVSLEYNGIPPGQVVPTLETQTIHYWVNKTT